MSCTDNESGPFVVFFLPAVVGCITILLARRWANSQVPTGSSTAVSRRRKIIKDPLVKRPLPPIACKMMPPTSKKTAGVTKKGTYSVLEDDVNGSGKRAGRPARLSPPASNGAPGADVKYTTDGPVPPKHIPFPNIPQDGELLFELMTFVFTLVATGLQFLNLYRTVWWLPQSYTNQAMNFYLIDPHVVAFIVTILSRRVLLCTTTTLINCLVGPKLWPHAAVAARMFILGVVIGALAWCTYFIALKYPLLKLFYLCYPAVIYVLLFGASGGPFLELSRSERPPLHCCSHDPHQVRAEVDTLRGEFNSRVKRILFNSVTGAYYSSFVPCCFAHPHLYYDVHGAAHQVALVWAALCARLASHLLSAQYCDVAHRAALHLGTWTRAQDAHTAGAGGGVEPWCGTRLWARGARCQADGLVFTSAAPATAAAPLSREHARFYAVFRNPASLWCVLVCAQLALVVTQLCMLFSSAAWHHFLSTFLLLFINYYTMYKLVRDYLVAWKVYKAELMIQDKALLAPVT